MAFPAQAALRTANSQDKPVSTVQAAPAVVCRMILGDAVKPPWKRGRGAAHCLISAVVLTACTASQHSAAPNAVGHPPSRPGPSATASAIPPRREAETPLVLDTCTLTSSTDVARAFGAKIVAEHSGTTGIGHLRCEFVASTSNVGASGRVVTTSNDSGTVQMFMQMKAVYPDAIGITVAAARAFYSPSASLLLVMESKTIVTVHAVLNAPGSPAANARRIKDDLAVLARSIAASL
jgi:hypothetical protein